MGLEWVRRGHAEGGPVGKFLSPISHGSSFRNVNEERRLYTGSFVGYRGSGCCGERLAIPPPPPGGAVRPSEGLGRRATTFLPLLSREKEPRARGTVFEADKVNVMEAVVLRTKPTPERVRLDWGWKGPASSDVGQPSWGALMSKHRELDDDSPISIC